MRKKNEMMKSTKKVLLISNTNCSNTTTHNHKGSNGTHTHSLSLSLFVCECVLDETIWLFFFFLSASVPVFDSFDLVLLSVSRQKKRVKNFGCNLLCVGFLVFGSVLSIYIRFRFPLCATNASV